jgi:hypothetical protein
MNAWAFRVGRTRPTSRVLTAASATWMLLAGGCATTLPTYELHLPVGRAQAVETMQKALSAEGLACSIVDEEHGVLATTWRDSGYEVTLAQVGDDMVDYADIFRRYRVFFVDKGGATRVVLQVDGRRCLSGTRVEEGNVLDQCGDADGRDAAVLAHDFRLLMERLARDTHTTAQVVAQPARLSRLALGR